MAIITVDAVRLVAPSLDDAVRFFGDFGLEPVSNSGRIACLQTSLGGEVVIDEACDAFDKLLGLREVVWGVESEADLEVISLNLSRDRTVERKDDEIRSFDDCGLRIAFRLSRRYEVPEVLSAVNTPARTERVNRRIDFFNRTRPRQIGHYAVYLPDYRKAENFYRDRLGFRVSDSFPGRGVFLRAPGSHYHHNIFALTRPNFSGLHHISFEVNNFQEIVSGGMYMTKAGWKTQMGPGRHMIGSNYFWYFESPLGGAVEYFADMDYLTDEWEAREWEYSPEIVAPWKSA